MNKLMIATMVAAVSLSALAAGVKGVWVDGKEIAYIGKAVKGDDGVIKLTPETVFIGDKIVKDAKGVCSKETSTLISMDKVESMGQTVQLPNVEYRRVPITCPS